MKTYYLILFLLVLTLNSFGQIVQIENNNFIENGNIFKPLVLNYDLQLRWDKSPNSAHPIYISPAHRYNDAGGPNPCADRNDCINRINNDFYQIRTLGFNAIRIVGHTTFSNYPKNTGAGSDFQLWAVADGWGDEHFTFPNITPPYTLSFNLIEEILQIATQNGLKVILLTGGGTPDHYTTKFKDYLNALTLHFKNDKRILAYDLLNEPDIVNQSNISGTPYSKAEICKIVNPWINIIKKNTKNLVTIGPSLINSVWKWDPTILNLDFISFHIYPNNQEDSFEAYSSELYWASKSIKKPWIIGETGFASGFGDSSIQNNQIAVGTQLEQVGFAKASAQKTLDCGGIGYSWWEYSDSSENYLGVIDENDNNKLVASEFRNMQNLTLDKKGCVKPRIYYNPTQFDRWQISGRIKDRYGNRIENAVIRTNLNTNEMRGLTFSDTNGNFTVQLDKWISYIDVSAIGYETRKIFYLESLLPLSIRLDKVFCDDCEGDKKDCKKTCKKDKKKCKTTCKRNKGACKADARRIRRNCLDGCNSVRRRGGDRRRCKSACRQAKRRAFSNCRQAKKTCKKECRTVKGECKDSCKSCK